MLLLENNTKQGIISNGENKEFSRIFLVTQALLINIMSWIYFNLMKNRFLRLMFVNSYMQTVIHDDN